jgi:hypothetical protein
MIDAPLALKPAVKFPIAIGVGRRLQLHIRGEVERCLGRGFCGWTHQDSHLNSTVDDSDGLSPIGMCSGRPGHLRRGEDEVAKRGFRKLVPQRKRRARLLGRRSNWGARVQQHGH